MADDAAFYEEDESTEDLRAAWNTGAKGATSGSRDLNQRAKFIVDRAIARFEGRSDVRLVVVSSGTTATTDVDEFERRVSPVERVGNESVTALAYPVG